STQPALSGLFYPGARRSIAPRPSIPPQGTRWLGIALSREELVRTGMLFALIFLAALVFVVGRTARDALFLTRYPVTWIGRMWIAYGVVSSLVALGYARFAERLPRVEFSVGFAIFAAASHLVLRVLMLEDVRAAYAIFYVWSDVLSNLLAVVA